MLFLMLQLMRLGRTGWACHVFNVQLPSGETLPALVRRRGRPGGGGLRTRPAPPCAALLSQRSRDEAAVAAARPAEQGQGSELAGEAPEGPWALLAHADYCT